MEDQWPYHAVADVILAHSLLRSMPEVDAGRIGITGISWGGYLTCVVSGLDDRFRFAVPVYGCGFLGDNSTWAPALEKLGARGSGGSRCGTRRIISRTVKCPNSGSPAPTISPTRWTRSRSRIGSRAVLQPCASGCGCRMAIGGPAENAPEIVAFADSIVGQGTPLATILDHGRDRDRVWARFRSESTIASAELLYTEDEGAWPDRRWETAPAKLDLSAKTVTASLPPTTKVFYLNLIDDHKRIVSTEHEETKSTLPNTSPLTEEGDLSQAMLDGLHRFAERKIDESVAARAKLWKRDTSSPEAYEKSIQANRESFRRIIGVVDSRVPVTMERFGDDDSSGPGGRERRLPGLTGALAGPGGRPRRGLAAGAEGAGRWATSSPCPTRTRRRSRSRAWPPASRSDRSSPGGWRRTAFASWCRRLISRGVDFSGNPRIAMTNQPHREWIYRQAYHMGRHVIGYEVQKVLAAVDWFKAQAEAGREDRRRRLRRRRPDRLLRRGRGPADRRGPGQRLLRLAAARLGRADLSQRLGPAARVRRCRDRDADRPARAGGRAQRGAARGRPARRAAGAGAAGPRSASSARRRLDDVLAEWQRLDALLPAGLPATRVLVHGERRPGARLRRPGSRAGLRRVARRHVARWSSPRGRRPTGARASTRTNGSSARSRSWRTTSSAWSAPPTRRATPSSSITPP